MIRLVKFSGDGIIHRVNNNSNSENVDKNNSISDSNINKNESNNVCLNGVKHKDNNNNSNSNNSSSNSSSSSNKAILDLINGIGKTNINGNNNNNNNSDDDDNSNNKKIGDKFIDLTNDIDCSKLSFFNKDQLSQLESKGYLVIDNYIGEELLRAAKLESMSLYSAGNKLREAARRVQARRFNWRIAHSHSWPSTNRVVDTSSTKTRSSAVTIWKTEDAGQLRLHLFGEHIDIDPLGDRLLIFLSEYVPHEVLVSNANERIAITSWFY
ncbi:hypothetical protein PPL_09831 [Heterostelium album PN500]|uniref:Prolyl 4-hydroxylase alpha subunit Fe(2+) 2OG dioxygenase domain-containing protein n=1 Tax=Heterostelium pallidum (strain ATCC 26659 / Pp 5 / PN500) TaxID=670386 RepID=D3BP68_HETP5|nr:hypothetical protein PPL_09831 [Heterostelium album PN500]EFA77078.1 hypothetical protein PPL_09831 [Heterostelium album PN500]|eukprot:XP_020429207.1 hypothetical protein PPL_09831 [Heterostelium album PN500]